MKQFFSSDKAGEKRKMRKWDRRRASEP